MSDQVAQGFVKSCLEILQGWGPHSLTRQPVLLVNSSHRQKDFAYIPSELPLFQLMPLASHPPAIPHREELGSIFLITSPRNWKAAISPPNPISSPGWISPPAPASLQGVSVLAPDHLGGFLLNLLQFVSVLYWGSKTGPQMQSNECQEKEIIAEGEIMCSTCFAINLQYSRRMGLVITQMKRRSVILWKSGTEL